MYLRPANLFKEFLIQKRTASINAEGRKYVEYKSTQERILCVLADASEKEIDRWQKLQHPISHTLVQYGCKPVLNEGDRLVLGDRYFDIVGRNELSSIGAFTLYYAEEGRESDG